MEGGSCSEAKIRARRRTHSPTSSRAESPVSGGQSPSIQTRSPSFQERGEGSDGGSGGGFDSDSPASRPSSPLLGFGRKDSDQRDGGDSDGDGDGDCDRDGDGDRDESEYDENERIENMLNEDEEAILDGRDSDGEEAGVARLSARHAYICAQLEA